MCKRKSTKQYLKMILPRDNDNVTIDMIPLSIDAGINIERMQIDAKYFRVYKASRRILSVIEKITQLEIDNKENFRKMKFLFSVVFVASIAVLS